MPGTADSDKQDMGTINDPWGTSFLLSAFFLVALMVFQFTEAFREPPPSCHLPPKERKAFSTYYVAPDGDDSRKGISPDESFKTLEKALSRAVKGNYIMLSAGTYRYEKLDKLVERESGNSIALRPFKTDKVVLRNRDSSITLTKEAYLELD